MYLYLYITRLKVINNHIAIYLMLLVRWYIYDRVHIILKPVQINDHNTLYLLLCKDSIRSQYINCNTNAAFKLFNYIYLYYVGTYTYGLFFCQVLYVSTYFLFNASTF